MPLKLSKKTFLLILLILFSLFLFVILLYFYILKPNNQKNVEVFDTLYEYCNSTTKDNIVIFECEAFIVGENIDAKTSERCFGLSIYHEFKDLKELELCDKKSNTQWANPYENYDKYIPINLIVTYQKQFLPFVRTSVDLKIALMPDDQLFQILGSYPNNLSPDENLRNNVYISSNEDIKEKGYYLTGKQNSNSLDTLALHRVTIKEINVNKEKILLGVNAKINNVVMSFEIDSREFLYSFVEEEVGIKEIIIDYKNIDLLKPQNSVFQVFLKFNPEQINIEEFLGSLPKEGEEKISLEKQFEIIWVSEVYENIS